MAKYTENDPDIKKLDNYEKEDYNMFLSKYNVDDNQQIINGIFFLKNPNKINLYKIEHWFKLLLLIPILIIVILIIANVIIMTIQYKRNYFYLNPTNKIYLISSSLFILFFIILLISFTFV